MKFISPEIIRVAVRSQCAMFWFSTGETNPGKICVFLCISCCISFYFNYISFMISLHYPIYLTIHRHIHCRVLYALSGIVFWFDLNWIDLKEILSGHPFLNIDVSPWLRRGGIMWTHIVPGKSLRVDTFCQQRCQFKIQPVHLDWGRHFHRSWSSAYVSLELEAMKRHSREMDQQLHITRGWGVPTAVGCGPQS
jgi:hypothetical protein